MPTRVIDGAAALVIDGAAALFSGCRPRFAGLAASPLPRACIALTKTEEKERLLAVYNSSTGMYNYLWYIPRYISGCLTQLDAHTP